MAINSETDIDLRHQGMKDNPKEISKPSLPAGTKDSQVSKDDHVTFRDLLTAVMGMQVITAAIIWLTILITRGTI